VVDRDLTIRGDEQSVAKIEGLHTGTEGDGGAVSAWSAATLTAP